MRPLKDKLLLTAIILLGMLFRVWGIGFGLPYLFHQDEPIIVNHALAYGTGDLNPHFFIIPPFCSYLLFFCYALYFLFGRLVGLFGCSYDFASSFFLDPTIFYLIARGVLGLAPSLLAVYLVYLVYRKLFGKEGALYAALLMSVSFLNIVNAHYAYVDNWLVLSVVLMYFLLLRLYETPNRKNYFLAGVCLGISIAIKYNAALLVAPFFILHFFVHSKQPGFSFKKFFLSPFLWFALLTAITAFFAANPFALIDHKSFLSSVLGKIRSAYMGWGHHFAYSLNEGVGFALLLTGLLGISVIIAREKKEKSLFFLSFPLIFYVHLALKSQPFSRYVLPLIPFICMGAAYVFFKELLPRSATTVKKILVLSLAALVFVPTYAKSLKAIMLFSEVDTRAEATRWVETYIPEYSRIAVDHTSFRPHITQTKEQIKAKSALLGNEEGMSDIKGKKMPFLLKAVENRTTYEVYFLTYKTDHEIQFLSMAPALSYDLDALRKEKIQYVVINFNTSNPEKEAFLKELKKHSRQVAFFSPYYDKRIRYLYDTFDSTGLAVGSRELFARSKPGPSLVIYKIED